LKNIQLKFLPPNTSLVQSVDTQFLKNLKVLYHGKFINYILEANEENHDITFCRKAIKTVLYLQYIFVLISFICRVH
jgi:hypothetical protein